MEHAAAEPVTDQAPLRRTAEVRAASPHHAPPAAGRLLRLQRMAGNQAVGALVSVQRAIAIPVNGMGTVSDVDGPGTNVENAVREVQQKLVVMEFLTAAEAKEDSDRVSARGERAVLASDLPKTLAALPAVDKPSLTEHAAKQAIKADLVGGVGAGEMNDAADAELILNLLHEEWHVSNEQYDQSIVALSGVGHTIDPATLPGFLPALVKLKRAFVGGFPWRGTTAKRKKNLVTEGTADYQKALDYNLAGREQMKAWLAEAAGQTKDLLLRNSAQWLLEGRSKVFCQSKTHDSLARVKADHKPLRFWAIFGGSAGPITEPQVPYNRKLKGEAAFDNANVAVEAPSGGWESAGQIGVVDPQSGGKKAFFDTIRHEAQHGADHQPDTDVGLYQTEYNARSVEERFKPFSATRKVKGMGYTWTQRQFAMFMDIWNYPDLYPYLQKNWNNPDRTQRKAWRDMVLAYRVADTFNPNNSVRIANLFDAMTACTTADCRADDEFGRGKGPENAKASAVRTCMTALDALDRGSLKTNIELNQLALLNLFGRIRAEYFAL